MLSLAQSQQKRWVSEAWQPRFPSVRFFRKSPPTSPTAASGIPSRELFIGPDLGLAVGVAGTFHGALFFGLGDRGGEELGDDLDREDADDAAVVADHRRVHRLALEEVG